MNTVNTRSTPTATSSTQGVHTLNTSNAPRASSPHGTTRAMDRDTPRSAAARIHDGLSAILSTPETTNVIPRAIPATAEMKAM